MSDDVRVRDYVRDRVEQYRGWYDNRARKCKKWYLRLRVAGLASGAVVPALIALPDQRADMAAILVSLITLVTLALDGMLRLREQWENYRYTEQYLDREKHMFLAAAGPYRSLAGEAAFLRFVERIEWAIAAENSTTLATLALAPTVEGKANGGNRPAQMSQH
ncbi:DUF4231 domain-containing protein [Blastococcus sp. SYSU DS1021]